MLKQSSPSHNGLAFLGAETDPSLKKESDQKVPPAEQINEVEYGEVGLDDQVKFLCELPNVIINALIDGDIENIRTLSSYELNEEELNNIGSFINEFLEYRKSSILGLTTKLCRNINNRYPLRFLTSLNRENGVTEFEAVDVQQKLIVFCRLFNSICTGISSQKLIGVNEEQAPKRERELYHKSLQMGDKSASSKSARLNYFWNIRSNNKRKG